MNRLTRTVCGLTVLLTLQPGWAARPLASDDAATADPATCQVEGWGERAGSSRAWVLAPACGVAKGVEVGAELAWPRPADVVRHSAGLALKVAPAGWALDSGLGEIRLGVKLNAGWDRLAAGGTWQHSGSGVLGLLSLADSDRLNLHLNLGLQRQPDVKTATLLNLAAVFQMTEQLMLFGELQANNRRESLGGTVMAAGARWWLDKDKLGLDLTAARENGSPATLWTFGFGWYGIGL